MRAQPKSLIRRGSVAVLAVALAGTVAMPSASAAAKRTPTPVVATANGTVGVAQSVTVGAPGAAGTTVTVQLALGGTVLVTQPVSLNAQGSGGFTWTPTKAGTWTVSGVSGAAPASITVAAVPTRTSLFAPNQTPAGSGTVLVATVASVSSYLPAGTVTFTNAYTGEVLGTAAVGGTSTGAATGRVAWTPSSPTGYRLTATYAAADGSAVGSSSTNTSQVLPNGPLVSLLVPPTLTYGQPVTITTRINNTLLTGGVATWVNDNGTLTQLPQAGGVIEQETSAAWTPSVLGNQLLNASFSSTNSSLTGTSVQWVSVRPAPAADPMSVLVGGGGPLSTAAATTVAGGSRLAVTAASGSGAPVTFVASGPCYLAGGTLVTSTAGGSCRLVATSPGAGAFGPNSATFTLTVTKTVKR